MDKIKESSKNYLDCQSSTKEKMRQLKEIFKKYNINGDVDIK